LNQPHPAASEQDRSAGAGFYFAEASIITQTSATDAGTLGRRYRLAEQVVVDRLGDSMVAVQLGTDKIFDLNETAARLVELLGEGRTAGEAADVIAGEYDATAEAVRQDVVSTVSTLITESVLEVVTDDI